MASPLINKREDLKAIYQYLAEAAKKGKVAPARKVIFEKVFPLKEFDDQGEELHGLAVIRKAGDE